MDSYFEELRALIDLSQSRPLNEIVYEGLQKAILTGIIPIGERINEKAYAERLNISRTPIRSSIERLVHEDILEHIPNYGVVVKSVTEEDVEEIYKIRIALDTLAAINAMNLMEKTEFTEMKSLLDQTEQLEKTGEIAQVIEQFDAFNNLIYDYAQMPRLKMIVKKMWNHLIRFRDYSFYNEGRRQQALTEHRSLYECLKNKDEKALTEEIALHLQKSKQATLDSLQKKQKN